VGVPLNAVSEVLYEFAIEIARQQDLAIQNNTFSLHATPFFGLPISIKECIGMKNTISHCGQLRHKFNVENVDSDFVKALLGLGVIPVVKSSTVSFLVMGNGANLLTGYVLNP